MIRVVSMTLVASLLLLTSGISAAHAQYYYWDSWYRSSTVYEANARGLGALIRDIGARNLLDAMAAREYEEARALYIQNTVAAVQAYYDRKQARENFYAYKRERDKEALDRFIERRGTLPKLTQNDIDPSTGRIHWPLLLQIESYDKYRQPYENLVAQHFQNGVLPVAGYLEAQKLSREWRRELGKDRHNFVVEHARRAIRFILAVDRELTRS